MTEEPIARVVAAWVSERLSAYESGKLDNNQQIKLCGELIRSGLA